MRVLVIEDDQRLAGIIRRVLEDDHYKVDVVYDGLGGLEFAMRGIYDLVIVDWMLPGRDGPSIVREIRKARMNMGILMLTARGQVEDRVAGLDSGTDDYLVKPFTFDELLARLRSISRRFAPTNADSQEIRVGHIVMDLATHSMRRSDQIIELSRTEWDLLEYLLRHPGIAMSRQKILEYVWSYDSDVRQDLVDVYISYLRHKLNTPGLPDPIQTVRGVGYRFDAAYA